MPPEKSKDKPNSIDEEISRLKHSIRVLEKTLQVEKKLAQEYYAELCVKIRECEDLKTDYVTLERKLDCLQEMSDIQDELVHSNKNLAAAEKTLISYKNKIDNLEVYKERAIELESKVKDVVQSQTTQHEQVSDRGVRGPTNCRWIYLSPLEILYNLILIHN